MSLKPFRSWGIFLCIVFAFFNAAAQQAQHYNRFQYHKYRWKVLHTVAFHLYFPAGYDSLASFASVQLPDIINETQAAIGSTFGGQPALVLYPAIDQLYETNIGLNDPLTQTFPTISLKGKRILVAFNGSYEKFRSQLLEAWVRLTWEDHFKSDVQEQISNQKQQIPFWFKEGCICFFASGWTIADEQAWQNCYRYTATQDWVALTERSPSLSGKAFCYFLSQYYRKNVVKTLFGHLKGKSLARAARLTTQESLDTLLKQCLSFYRQRFIVSDSLHYTMPDTLTSFLEARYKGRIFSLKYTSDRQQICFIIQKHNRRDVYITPLEKLRNPKKEADPFFMLPDAPWLENYDEDPYPLCSWQADGKGLYSVLPEKGQLQLKRFNTDGSIRDSRTLYGVDGVSSVTAWGQDLWLLAASRRGRSDIVLYDAQKQKYLPLTSDWAEHIEPDFAKGEARTLTYRSGFPADSVYHKDTTVKKYGIYYKEVTDDLKASGKKQDRLLVKDSAFISWHDPKMSDQDRVAVTTTRHGIQQRDTLNLQYPIPSIAPVKSPWLQDYMANLKTGDSLARLKEQRKHRNTVSIFQKVLAPQEQGTLSAPQKDSLRREVAYTGKKVRPYILQLYSAYFSAQINNDYYINRYQPFQAYLGTFNFPEVGAMIQGGFSDLFENHHFNIGYRLPVGTEGSDFFVRYENTARMIDWHVLFFRKVESLKPDPDRDWTDNQGNSYPAAAKVKTHYYELGFHYPLHYDWSLDFTTAARRDRTIFLATDRYSLDYEALQAWWSMNSLVLHVNKLQPTIPFLYKGWEAKAMLDGMASTGKASTVLYGTQLRLAWHQPLVKDINVVIQAQGGYSGGDSRILYNFGGVDNNLVTRIDTTVKFSQKAPYAFQSLITPFRGYAQNSIYGSRFGLLNVDVYFPLFRSLVPLHTGFSALNNLQLGLFTDIAATSGTTGLPPVKSTLNSYGCSARTLLAGYPLRLDVAWPGDFGKKPVWYLSLKL